VSKICVQFDARKKSNNQAVLSLQNVLSSLDLQNRSPKYWRIIRNTSGHFEKHFSKANEPPQKKNPEIYFGRKRFRTIFEKRTPIYSLLAPLIGLAKSIYFVWNSILVTIITRWKSRIFIESRLTSSYLWRNLYTSLFSSNFTRNNVELLKAASENDPYREYLLLHVRESKPAK